MRRLIHTAANPVAADLVNRAADYPGLFIHSRDIGTTITAKRPHFFLRDSGLMQKTVAPRLEVPPEFAHLVRDGYSALLEEKLRAEEPNLLTEGGRRTGRRWAMGADPRRQAALGRRTTKLNDGFGRVPRSRPARSESASPRSARCGGFARAATQR